MMADRAGAGAHQHRPPPLDLSSLALPPLPPAHQSPMKQSQPASYTSSTRPRPSFAQNGGVPPALAPMTRQPISASPSTSSASPSTPYGRGMPVLPPKPASPELDRVPFPRSSPGTSPARPNHVPGYGDMPDTRPLPSPPSATSPVMPSGRRPNPLEDLIQTENLYVEDLAAIIKRVAAAWSRTNFPPPALDAMFRAIEAVYRINKTLLAKLEEIGPNPSSPKALGDLLMRWIADLSPAYSRYAATYQVDYDRYEPVQRNQKLAPILDSLSWPSTLPPASHQNVTLDVLFRLPSERLEYYKKLYTKLLRSTQEGRSDHALLLDANQQIDQLIASCKEGKGQTVLAESAAETLPLFSQRKDLPKIDEQTAKDGFDDRPPRQEAPRFRPTPRSPADSSLDSPVDPPTRSAGTHSEDRSSGDSARLDSSSSSFHSLRSSSATDASTANTSAVTHLASSRNLPTAVEDLERRMSTERVLDIFTMTPKKCKLQISPPGLPFARQIRRSADVAISFVPQSDPRRQEVNIRNAHIFLLTDLFLVCEYMTSEERLLYRNGAEDGPDMWLVFPPLAGKHLRIDEGMSKSEFEVTIMRKEKLLITAADAVAAQEWKTAFEQAIAFGNSNPPPSRASSASSGSGMSSPITPPAGKQSFARQQLKVNTDIFNGPGQGHLRGNGAVSPQSRSAIEASRLDLPPRSGLGPGPESASHMAPHTRQQPYGDPRRAQFGGQSPLYPRAGHRSNGMESAGPPSAATASSHSPYPFSPAYPPSDYTRGTSPSSSAAHHSYNPVQGFVSPGGPPRPMTPSTDFYRHGPMSNGRPGDLSHSGSVKSTSSFASGWTERSSFPEPPPLPGKYGRPGVSEYHGPPSSRSMGDLLSPGHSLHKSKSVDGLRAGAQYRMPSELVQEARSNSAPGSSYAPGRPEGIDDDSPPSSPVKSLAPERTSVTAQMRCKMFLQQNVGQWKSVGTGKLKLFLSTPSMTKQLVVDHDKSNKTVISTIVLTDGVERVGKTGVAIELTDRGERSGIIYMLQMKTEQAATGLFEQLLVGSDRAKRITR